MYLYLHLRPQAGQLWPDRLPYLHLRDLQPGRMKSARKGSAAAVGVDRAAVGALPGRTKPDPASQHDAAAAGDDVAAVGALEEKDDEDDESATGQKAKKTPRQCNPRVTSHGFKMTVGEGQQEAARAALKIARKGEKAWTNSSWKAVMKNILKSFRSGVSHGGCGRIKVQKPSDDGAGSTPGLEKAAVGASAEAETHLPKVEVASISSPLGSVAEMGLPGVSTLRNQLRIGSRGHPGKAETHQGIAYSFLI